MTNIDIKYKNDCVMSASRSNCIDSKQIIVSDTDFGEYEYEKQTIEATGIAFRGFAGEYTRAPKDIIKHLQNADGAITSYGSYTAEVFEACPKLKVVAKTGTGVDNIDVEAATKAGCAVCNVVGYGTEVVSDHAIALAMDVLRRVSELSAAMHRGVWDFQQVRPLGQAAGRIFGVVGYGNIGKAAARKAAGLGFKVVVWDRSGIPGTRTAEGFECLSLDELLTHADVISFHTALTPETHHLLNADNICLLKDDATVVNTSRGAVIDTDAVAERLRAGKLWGAGIDVFEQEPVDPDSAICKAPHVTLTPHAAYWSEESIVELRRRATQNAINVVCGRRPENCVNPEVLEA
jgi:D-3-phosphoglycerate dehydrogenase